MSNNCSQVNPDNQKIYRPFHFYEFILHVFIVRIILFSGILRKSIFYFRRQDEKRYEEMRARARAIHQEDRATQDKINSLLSEQIERQKDFLHWAAGKNTQLGDR